jgi:hypothetical protein
MIAMAPNTATPNWHQPPFPQKRTLILYETKPQVTGSDDIQQCLATHLSKARGRYRPDTSVRFAESLFPA